MEQSMTQYKSQGVRSLTIAVCAALLITSSGNMAFSQQAAPAKPGTASAVSAPAPAPAPPAGKPFSEEETDKRGGDGIKVHGHWVLQVKNTDGTLGERREFENSLVTTGSPYLGGDELLVNLITGQITPGNLMIGMIMVNPTTYPDPSGWCAVRTEATCYMMTTPNSPYLSIAANYTQTTLTITTPFLFLNGPNNPRTPTIVLAGNFTVQPNQLTLNAVGTFASVCVPGSGVLAPSGADYAPQNCVFGQTGGSGPTGDASNYSPFTATVIGGTTPAPLTNLTTGQIIQVTVTISFS